MAYILTKALERYIISSNYKPKTPLLEIVYIVKEWLLFVPILTKDKKHVPKPAEKAFNSSFR